MNIQEWTSIISAIIAAASAVSARIERIKADASAKKALSAQEEIAVANNKLARLQEITNAREANQLLVRIDEADENLIIFNPFGYEVRNLRVDYFEVANSPVTVSYLEPHHEAKLTLKPNTMALSRSVGGNARLKWDGENGKRLSQTWRAD